MADGLLVDIRGEENSPESDGDSTSTDDQRTEGRQRLLTIGWMVLITHLLVGFVFVLHVLAFHGVI